MNSWRSVHINEYISYSEMLKKLVDILGNIDFDFEYDDKSKMLYVKDIDNGEYFTLLKNLEF